MSNEDNLADEIEYTGNEDRPSPEIVAGYAIQDNDFATMRELITSGQISLEPDEYGNSFLHQAAANASPEMIKMLITMGADMHVRNENGMPPYEVAMTSWNAEGLNGFLDAGLSLDAKGSQNMPLPLEVAALADWQTMETFLQKTGVDVNYADETGYSLAHAACAYGNVGTLTTLMNKGGRADQKDIVGSTPMHRLVAYRHLAPERELCIDRLIYMGADLNAQDNKGKTPMHIAVQFGAPRLVKKLINEGADVNIKDQEGKTPMDRLEDTIRLSVPGSERHNELMEIKKTLQDAGGKSGAQLGFVAALREAARAELTDAPSEQRAPHFEKDRQA